MKLKPIRDRIVVQMLEAETVTKSGLVIPDAAAEKPSQGDVLAVGTGKIAEDGTIVPMVIQTGDRVLFSKTAGQKVKIDDQEYLIMREEDVMAVVNQGE
jgi:chaperonin GroES